MGKTKLTAYINGKFVSEEKASISVFDRGFAYGDGLFETIRARDGRPLVLAENLQRLKAGAKAIRLPEKTLNTPLADIDERLLAKLLNANGLTDNESYVKIIVTRGVDRGALCLRPASTPPSSYDQASTRPSRKGPRKGLKLRAGPLPDKILTTSNVLAGSRQRTPGPTRGSSRPQRGVTEGTSTNLFIVLKGILRTPPLIEALCSRARSPERSAE